MKELSVAEMKIFFTVGKEIQLDFLH